MSEFQRYLDEQLENIHVMKEDMFAEPEPEYDVYAEIRQAISDLRQEQHMTQKELAAKAGLTQANISNLEKGTTRPTIETLKKIAKATGTRLHIEFDGEEVL